MGYDKTECSWIINKTNQEYVDYISRLASVSQTFAQVLINRGLKTSEQLDVFLNPDASRLSDPFELPCMKDAIERIRAAKNRGEKILVHGDYDADGVTATAVMVEGLRELGLDVEYFIPHRVLHGYGFGAAGIEKAKKAGAGLVITVDCGITSFEAVSAANSAGIDVIVTDHHEPARAEIEDCGADVAPLCPSLRGGAKGGILLPDALAVVNPKISGAVNGNANLSGAGVALKIMQGLFENDIGTVYKFLDLAAIGTAADVVPVIDDNRILIKEGLKLIRTGHRRGIRALKDAAGIKADFFKTSFLHYIIIPRLNAAGRISDATDVVRLLTTDSDSEAEELAGWLNGLNYKRQEIEETVYNEALNMLDSVYDGSGAIVLASEGWHLGVVGIVASKLAERYYRPAIVLSIENGVAKGSGRSIPSFDMHCGLTKCKDVLDRFGGHKQAAGLSLSAGNIGRFRKMLSGIVAEELPEDKLMPVLQIDASVKISEIGVELVDEFARLEPFGYGNAEPVLGAKNLEVIQPRIVGNNHLKMHLRQGSRRVDSIGFDCGNLLNVVEDNAFIDAAFLPVINEWDGGRYLQLNLKAIRPANQS